MVVDEVRLDEASVADEEELVNDAVKALKDDVELVTDGVLEVPDEAA